MNDLRTLLLLPLLPLLPLLLLCACGGDDPADSTEPGDGEVAHTVEFDFAPEGPIPDDQLGEFNVVLTCSIGDTLLGDMAFTLWPDIAPKALRRFLRHTAEGTYDGTTIHRVAREFVIQGGDPAGDGRGVSPYGVLEPELSIDPAYNHGYGVLALTEPPSLQFFVCAAESPTVWALDERPISRIGRLSAGLVVLEQIANAEVAYGMGSGERSAPTVRISIDQARVVRGPAPQVEQVRRPQPDLQGQPEVVAVQHILVTFTERAPPPGVNRNRLQAAARAQEVLGKIRSGDLTWEEALRGYTDEALDHGAPIPVRRMSNFGVHRLEGQRAAVDGQREMRLFQLELRRLYSDGVISAEELARRQDEKALEIEQRLVAIGMDRREDVNEAAYSAVAFGLELGEVGLVEYDAYESPGGWYLLRRVE